MKLDPTVKKETAYIAFWVVVLSLLTQAVFLVIGKWDYTVLLGNLLSGLLSVFNFFFMGLTVQKAVEKEEKEAKSTLKLSQSLRTLFMFLVVLLGVLLPCFSIWTTIIPLLFPRIAIAFRGLFNKNN